MSYSETPWALRRGPGAVPGGMPIVIATIVGAFTGVIERLRRGTPTLPTVNGSRFATNALASGESLTGHR